MSVRVQDFALMIGHAWRCTDCRAALLENPEVMWLGHKLSEQQRAAVLKLTDEAFQTVERLAGATGLDPKELEVAIEHPRARLRHLGSVKGDYFLRHSGTD